MTYPFEARYPGTCPACDDPIKVGDPIADTADGYTHDDCTDQPNRPEQPACPTCWLVHAGECDR